MPILVFLIVLIVGGSIFAAAPGLVGAFLFSQTFWMIIGFYAAIIAITNALER